MRESLFETLVGLAVVVVAAVFLVFSLQQRSEAAPRNSYLLNAKFNRVDGVSTGTDVRMSGVKVGTVTGVKLDPKTYKAVVTFTMDKKFQVPDDSTVQVISDGLLGGAYLGILVGGSFDYLPEGGTVEFTRGSVDFLTVLSELASNIAGGGNNGSEDPGAIGGDNEQGASP